MDHPRDAQLLLYDALETLDPDPLVRSWIYNDVELWPLVKFHLATILDLYVITKSTGQSVVHQASMPAKLQFFRRSLVRDVESRAALQEAEQGCDAAIFCYNSHRFFRHDGRWFHGFYDALRYFHERVGQRLTALEADNLPVRRAPPLSPTVNCTRDVIAARAVSRLSPVPRELRDLMRGIVHSLNVRLPKLSAYDIELPAADMARSMIFVESLARRFARRLTSLKPHRAYVVNYYSRSALAFCLACRRLGIPVADVSHGLSGRHHYAYGSWHWAPADGYRLLPSVFLTRTSDDAEAVQPIAHAHPAIEVGDPAAHAWRADAYGLRTRAPAPPPVVADIAARARIRPLLALQHASGLSEYDKALMRSAPDDYFFWARLHPLWRAQGLGDTTGIRPERFESSYATSAPLFALFEHASAVVTECSSVAADAIMFGIPAIVTSELGRRSYEHDIARGMVRYCPTPAAALDALEELGRGGAARRNHEVHLAEQRLRLEQVVQAPARFALQGAS
ncbi:MAG: hypothetical protein LC753_04390 [Acidobacteria bacterium]|nr:hypothetical protein [Acidobacteriota bacterium]MCA1649538.1 hypothetical protein [Acidobacteriota bacterium]